MFSTFSSLATLANKTKNRTKQYILKGKCHKLNLRITQECFQPKIGEKVRIFSVGRENNILIKKRVYQNLL